jgi:uncharacterized protein YndB with AHSA1/START domain
MTNPSDIDRTAPVVAHHEIEIAAPRGVVWRLLTDVDAWPRWAPEITEARLGRPLAVGASFDWTSYGFSVTSTVYALQDDRRVLWGGTSGGFTGIHEWRFDDADGGTRVTTSESFAGAPVEADPAGLQQMLDASLVAWLERLKAAAEAAA